MIHGTQIRYPQRAPRVSLQGTVSALLELENNRRIPVKLHQLSITGGLLELANYLEERTRVTLTVQIGPGTVRPKGEMLFPMRGTHGYLQPFRFTDLLADERQILEREIAELLKQTITPAKTGHASGFRPPHFFLESF
jgi:hypothetical protein